MFRVLPAKFKELLGLVGLKISQQNAPRKAFYPGERLSVALQYLVTGDAFSTVAANYCLCYLGHYKVGGMTKKICSSLWDILCAKSCLIALNSSE